MNRSSDTPSRREFLAFATAATVACGARAKGAVAANDRLRLASIGVGGMGASDLASLTQHKGVEVVALCDVDANHLAAAAEKFPNAQRFADYRELFERASDSFDAVNVATPDHSHAPATMLALQLNKHVYCQKPLTHSVYEARRLREVASERGVVTQMGTQVHSTSPYRTAVRLVQSGVIGKVRGVHSWSDKSWGYESPVPTPSAPPPELQWDLWLGTAPERPYSAGHYHPADWRRWRDFGCGTMGDMAIHILDPVFSALKLGAPTKIVASGSPPPAESFGLQNRVRFEFPATDYTSEAFELHWYDGGLRPDTAQWPKQALPDQGSMFIGEDGWLLLPHVAMPELLPADRFAGHAVEPAPDGDHYGLWVDACLGGAPTTAGFDYAGPLTEAVLLGVLANQFPGEELVWRPKAMAISNHSKASALLRRDYRDGWKIPGLS
jgi:predicted dehydrogenase